MKRRKLLSLITVLVFTGGILGGCGSNSQKTAKSNEKVTIVGSTALQPLVEKAADEYTNNNGGNITVQGGGSGTGLGQVQEGAVQIGNSDIFASQQKGIDAKKLVDHKVAVVGMAPIVNQDVNVKNLTMHQLQDIFTGKITNWKQVGGQDQKIVIVNRAKGSGTRATFESVVLNGKPAVSSQEQDSNGTVQKIVAKTPGAISYIAFSYLNKEGIQALNIDGVRPTDQNVETNKWKIWSYEHMYTKGKPTGATKLFLKYMMSNHVQDKLVKETKYISIHDMKVQKAENGIVTSKK